MRELRFRAWDRVRKRMYIGDEVHAIYHTGVLTVCVGNDDWMVMPPDYELLHYTDLPDKNGEEIYEGDRLKYEVKGFPIRTAVVEASPGRFTFYWEDEQGGESHTQPLYPYSEKCWEIIGNIHEIQSQS